MPQWCLQHRIFDPEQSPRNTLHRSTDTTVPNKHGDRIRHTPTHQSQRDPNQTESSHRREKHLTSKHICANTNRASHTHKYGERIRHTPIAISTDRITANRSATPTKPNRREKQRIDHLLIWIRSKPNRDLLSAHWRAANGSKGRWYGSPWRRPATRWSMPSYNRRAITWDGPRQLLESPPPALLPLLRYRNYRCYNRPSNIPERTSATASAVWLLSRFISASAATISVNKDWEI